MNDERSLMAGIDALRMGYAQKSTPVPTRPFARRGRVGT